MEFSINEEEFRVLEKRGVDSTPRVHRYDIRQKCEKMFEEQNKVVNFEANVEGASTDNTEIVPENEKVRSWTKAFDKPIRYTWALILTACVIVGLRSYWKRK